MAGIVQQFQATLPLTAADMAPVCPPAPCAFDAGGVWAGQPAPCNFAIIEGPRPQKRLFPETFLRAPPDSRTRHPARSRISPCQARRAAAPKPNFGAGGAFAHSFASMDGMTSLPAGARIDNAWLASAIGMAGGGQAQRLDDVKKHIGNLMVELEAMLQIDEATGDIRDKNGFRARVAALLGYMLTVNPEDIGGMVFEEILSLHEKLGKFVIDLVRGEFEGNIAMARAIFASLRKQASEIGVCAKKQEIAPVTQHAAAAIGHIIDALEYLDGILKKIEAMIKRTTAQRTLQLPVASNLPATADPKTSLAQAQIDIRQLFELSREFNKRYIGLGAKLDSAIPVELRGMGKNKEICDWYANEDWLKRCAYLIRSGRFRENPARARAAFNAARTAVPRLDVHTIDVAVHDPNAVRKASLAPDAPAAREEAPEEDIDMTGIEVTRPVRVPQLPLVAEATFGPGADEARRILRDTQTPPPDTRAAKDVITLRMNGAGVNSQQIWQTLEQNLTTEHRGCIFRVEVENPVDNDFHKLAENLLKRITEMGTENAQGHTIRLYWRPGKDKMPGPETEIYYQFEISHHEYWNIKLTLGIDMSERKEIHKESKWEALVSALYRIRNERQEGILVRLPPMVDSRFNVVCMTVQSVLAQNIIPLADKHVILRSPYAGRELQGFFVKAGERAVGCTKRIVD